MVKFLGVLLAAAALGSCRWPGGGDGGACAEQARLALPVDLADFAARGVIWPHGIHGGGNLEGHPGIDFVLEGGSSREIPVYASFASEIVAVAAEPENPGSSCLTLDSACVEVNLCHVRLDPGLGPGSRLARGQRLGSVFPTGPAGVYALHFGTSTESGSLPGCPADLLDPDIVRCRLGAAVGEAAPADCGNAAGGETLLGRSSYAETVARTDTVACADGSTLAFAFPAETRLCNARLPEAIRRRLKDCLGPACQGVW
jgi:hypothetical protein